MLANSLQDSPQEDDVAPLLQIHRSLSFNSRTRSTLFGRLIVGRQCLQSREICHILTRVSFCPLILIPTSFWLFPRKQPNHSNSSRSSNDDDTVVLSSCLTGDSQFSSYLNFYSFFRIWSMISHFSRRYCFFSVSFALSDEVITYCVCTNDYRPFFSTKMLWLWIRSYYYFVSIDIIIIILSLFHYKDEPSGMLRRRAL